MQPHPRHHLQLGQQQAGREEGDHNLQKEVIRHQGEQDPGGPPPAAGHQELPLLRLQLPVRRLLPAARQGGAVHEGGPVHVPPLQVLREGGQDRGPRPVAGVLQDYQT